MTADQKEVELVQEEEEDNYTEVKNLRNYIINKIYNSL